MVESSGTCGFPSVFSFVMFILFFFFLFTLVNLCKIDRVPPLYLFVLCLLFVMTITFYPSFTCVLSLLYKCYLIFVKSDFSKKDEKVFLS